MNSSVDFFNNVVTLSSVVLFAKFVTHRSRRGGVAAATSRSRFWHHICVLLSLCALTASFIAAELEKDPPWPLHALAAATLTGAVVVLVLDVVLDDAGK